MPAKTNLQAILPTSDIARPDALRRYAIKLHVVAFVDNETQLCGYCDSSSCRVAANVYLTTFDGEDHCLDVGLDCVFYVIDGHMDTDPDKPVTVEIATGVLNDPTR